MPYAQPVTGNPEFTVFYNVEQAVGSNAPNARDDVKLAQYMLRDIYGGPAGSLAVDGYIGPITVNWIRRFQMDARNAGNNVLLDGRVDRAQGYQSSVSKTVYTINLMNIWLKRINPSAFASLPTAVPLSENPRLNPYNPRPEGKKKTWTIISSNESGQYIIMYDDGGVEKVTVPGNFIVDGHVLRPGTQAFKAPDGSIVTVYQGPGSTAQGG